MAMISRRILCQLACLFFSSSSCITSTTDLPASGSDSDRLESFLLLRVSVESRNRGSATIVFSHCTSNQRLATARYIAIIRLKQKLWTAAGIPDPFVVSGMNVSPSPSNERAPTESARWAVCRAKVIAGSPYNQ